MRRFRNRCDGLDFTVLAPLANRVGYELAVAVDTVDQASPSPGLLVPAADTPWTRAASPCGMSTGAFAARQTENNRFCRNCAYFHLFDRNWRKGRVNQFAPPPYEQGRGAWSGGLGAREEHAAMGRLWCMVQVKNSNPQTEPSLGFYRPRARRAPSRLKITPGQRAAWQRRASPPGARGGQEMPTCVELENERDAPSRRTARQYGRFTRGIRRLGSSRDTGRRRCCRLRPSARR